MCNNHTSTFGGGLYIGLPGENLPSNLIITNNLIANNDGNGVYVRSDTAIFINNTIVNNTGYGLFSNVGSKYMKIVNCIMWGNQKPGISVITPEIHILNSDIEKIQMNMDPLFINPSEGFGTGYNGYTANWNFKKATPTVNAGSSDSIVIHKPYIGFINNKSDNKNDNDIEVKLLLNPDKDTLTVDVSEISEKSKLTILNNKDVVLWKQNITSLKTQISIGDLPNGLYFVKIESGQTETTLRFVKK
jgi:hypothetical protein